MTTPTSQLVGAGGREKSRRQREREEQNRKRKQTSGDRMREERYGKASDKLKARGTDEWLRKEMK